MIPRFIVGCPNVVANNLGTNAFIGQPNSLACEPGCLDCHRIANCHQQVRHTQKILWLPKCAKKMPKSAEKCPIFGTMGHNVLLVDTVSYPMAIQKPRCTCQAVWLLTKRMLAEVISEKRRKVPNCAEKCRKVPNIGHNSAIWCRIVPKSLPNIVPNCAEYLPKIPKSKIVQNTILGVHLVFLLFSRLPAFSLSRFLAFSLSRFPDF